MKIEGHAWVVIFEGVLALSILLFITVDMIREKRK